MKMPQAKVLYEKDKCMLTYDLKAILSLGIVFSINRKQFIIMFFGLTFKKY
jgi:hypothetical protein